MYTKNIKTNRLNKLLLIVSYALLISRSKYVKVIASRNAYPNHTDTRRNECLGIATYWYRAKVAF